jgi:DNA-binding NarL/FixJ family response regulator
MRVVIAEHEESVRSALRLLMDEMGWKVVGEVAQIDELMKEVTHTEPDVLLLNWDLPGFRAGVHLYTLRSRAQNTQIIALNTCEKPMPVPLGVDLIICKNHAPDTLFKALESISEQRHNH